MVTSLILSPEEFKKSELTERTIGKKSIYTNSSSKYNEDFQTLRKGSLQSS
jgi:hypothetical protein